DELHRHVPVALRREQLLERDQVRMRDVGGAAKLLLEAIQRVAVEHVQLLDRDADVVVGVLRFEHGAERAHAESAADQKPTGDESAELSKRDRHGRSAPTLTLTAAAYIAFRRS